MNDPVGSRSRKNFWPLRKNLLKSVWIVARLSTFRAPSSSGRPFATASYVVGVRLEDGPDREADVVEELGKDEGGVSALGNDGGGHDVGVGVAEVGIQRADRRTSRHSATDRSAGVVPPRCRAAAGRRARRWPARPMSCWK